MGNKFKRTGENSNANLSVSELKEKIQKTTDVKALPTWIDEIKSSWNERMTYARDEEVIEWVKEYDNMIIVKLYKNLTSMSKEILHRMKIHQKNNPGTLKKEISEIENLLSNLYSDAARPMGFLLREDANEEDHKRWCNRIEKCVEPMMKSFKLVDAIERSLTNQGVNVCNYRKE